jgi:hypothetical protein
MLKQTHRLTRLDLWVGSHSHNLREIVILCTYKAKTQDSACAAQLTGRRVMYYTVECINK